MTNWIQSDSSMCFSGVTSSMYGSYCWGGGVNSLKSIYLWETSLSWVLSVKREDMHTVLALSLLFSIPTKRLHSPEDTANCTLFMSVCALNQRGNTLGKEAKIRIGPSLFPPSLLYHCLSSVWAAALVKLQVSQTADGLHMICILDWHHMDGTWIWICLSCFLFNFLAQFSFLSFPLKSLHTQTKILSYPEPGGNGYPMLIWDDVTTLLRWMVHIRLSLNKSGRKRGARERGTVPRVIIRRKKKDWGEDMKRWKKREKTEWKWFPALWSFLLF